MAEIDYDFFVKIWASIQSRFTTSRWDPEKDRNAGVYPITEADPAKREKLIEHLKYYQEIYQPQWKYISFNSDYTAIIVMEPLLSTF